MSITEYNTFNVKSFINEVHKRRALWDVSHEDYKNRIVRQNAWLDICEVFASDFHEKDKEDRLIIGRELQQKWKYIRDAYMRQIKQSAMKASTGYARTYVYAKHLSFLNLNPSDYAPGHHQEEEGEEEKQAARRRRFIRSSTSGIIKPRKWRQAAKDKANERREEAAREPELNVSQDISREMDPLEKQGDHMSDDVAFFKSLLPTLSELKPSQKLLFRIDVMKILHSYATEANRIDTVFLPASSNDDLHEEFDMNKVSPNRNDYE